MVDIAAVEELDTPTGFEIAVIGMAGKFPGAKNIREFWENLKNGIEAVAFLTHEELEKNKISEEVLRNPYYVRSKGGVLEDIEYFDAAFFDYIPLEAQVMDPQIRFLHEGAWTALEDAGYYPGNYNGVIGIYAGASPNFDWGIRCIVSGKTEEIGSFNALHLTDRDFLCTRVAYKLGLKGPAVTVQTACSTSLLAIYTASRALLSGECDMALAGGVSISTSPRRGYFYQEGMILSADGHCRVFDADASGTVEGSGIGIVVLKPLEEALADRDHIYAVIKGAAVNNDGTGKAGYTAPSVDGQAEVIEAALHMAEVPAESITYIEAHGTGTRLGDPIEVEALTQAFAGDRKGFCALGAVKANIGHLDAAAGVAGFIKTVLALWHRCIPPAVNFKSPNPQIDFENSPFYVNTRLKQWKNDKYPLRAGVSAFGIGGTNVHAVLEESPAAGGDLYPPPSTSRRFQLILLSARTESALDKMTANLAGYFKANPGINLADAVYTLQVGRKSFEWRCMWVIKDVGEAIEILSGQNPRPLTTFVSKKAYRRPLIFLFPGQGAQYVNMGLKLYKNEPVFREEMDRCFEILKPIMGCAVKEILYPRDPVSGVSEEISPGTTEFQSPTSSTSYMSHMPHAPGSINIHQTEITQPLIFVIEYGLARLLMSWGIMPDAMLGHSIGEYAAACLSGVFSLEDVLAVVVQRGKLMQQVSTGSMLGVALPEEQLKPLLNPGISIAAVNNTRNCVVAGDHDTIAKFEKKLQGKGIDSRRLLTSHAFHSHMMEPILKEFEKTVQKVPLNKPKIPYISNLTGQWLTAQQAVDPAYWAKHLRNPVRFSEGLEELLKKENSIFVEVGPGRALSTLVEQHQSKKETHFIVNTIRHPQENIADDSYLLSTLGRLWLCGQTIDWSGFYPGEKRSRVPLPTYPFAGQRYWLEAVEYEAGTGFLPGIGKHTPLLPVKNPDPTHWLYVPSWKQSNRLINKDINQGLLPGNRNYLVFIDEHCHLGYALIQQIRQRGGAVILVKPGLIFARESGTIPDAKDLPVFQINPGEQTHYDILMRELQTSDKMPGTILHLWGVTSSNSRRLTGESIRKALDLGFYSLVYIARSIGNLGYIDELSIKVISNGLHELSGDEEISPGKSPLLGPVKVIPQEYSHINCQSIDILVPEPGSQEEQEILRQLLTELALAVELSGKTRKIEPVIAYRGGHRWVQTFESPEYPEPPDIPGEEPTGKLYSLVKKEGIYLITGGSGNIGFLLAKYLARTYNAKLVLTCRSPFPPKAEWKKWLDTHDHDEEDGISRKILEIQELEKSGAEISIFPCDAANYQQMQAVIAHSRKQWGGLNGIFHCAGLSRDILRPLDQLDKNYCEKQFQAKIYGLLVLERLLRENHETGHRGRPPDFCILMSSLSSILGGLGYTAYSAANHFMDAFSHAYWREMPTTLLSINWDAWEFPGSRGEFALTPDQGIKVFQRLFSLSLQGVAQVVVSTGDLPKRAAQWIGLEPLQNKSLRQRSRPRLSNDYEPPRSPLEQQLTGIWQEFFGIDKVGIHDNFFELGGDSLKGMTLVNRYKKLLGEMVYVQVVFDAPTIAQLSAFFVEHYPRAAAGVNGGRWEAGIGEDALYPRTAIDAARIADFRRLIPALPPLEATAVNTPKNAAAIFILSPSRSGSTLLRVMLGGHPELFAPPELNLLLGSTLEEVNQVAGGMEGALRALMQIKECSAEAAKSMMKGFLEQKLTSRQFYSLLQKGTGDKILVDKSPLYALNPGALKRAEEEFETPYYIHLVRHPYGMIRSKEEAKLNLIRGKVKNLNISRYELSELEWTVCHENILGFLKQVPHHRQYQVKFEDLLKEPRKIIEGICDFLGLKFNPAMLNPYQDKKQRMTDGIYPDGIMMGDPKFHEHQHKGINPETADKWKHYFKRDFLSNITWELAKSFGYERSEIKRTEGENQYIPIEAAEKKEYYVLSSAQRRLYVVHSLYPESLGYNLSAVFSAAGDIDKDRLEEAFARLITRYDILRTSFKMMENLPVQRIHEGVDFKIEYYGPGPRAKGLESTFPGGEQGTERRHINTDPKTGNPGSSPYDLGPGPYASTVKDFVRPFDLSKVPLLRVGLLKTGEGKTFLLLDKHHIISDGTSHQLLVKEFLNLYSGKQLPPLRLRYKDYTEWQRHEKHQKMIRQQESYWKDLLGAEVPTLTLPLDFPRPQIQNFAGREVKIKLSGKEATALKTAAKTSDATLYMVILSVFNILISKLCNQEDIIVGTPIAARNHPDIENMVGMFVNMLAMRNQPRGPQTYLEFLAAVKENCLQAFAHQDVPFEDLVEHLNLERDLSRNPLFDVSMAVQNFEVTVDEGQQFVPVRFENQVSRFDLTLLAFEWQDEIYFNLGYCTKIFNQETIEKFCRYFLRIIKQVLEKPGLRLLDIDILSGEEKELLVYSFNRTEVEYPCDKTIHELFTHQAARTPYHAAVVATGPGEDIRYLFYNELDKKSQQLAALLVEKGCGPTDIVPIMTETSLETIIGIMSILKAGACYLPIDPSNPTNRLTYILNDSKTKLLLTQKHLENKVPFKGDVLNLEDENLYNRELELPKKITGFNDPLYMIYTSGTTGNPKGVQLTHKNLVNYVAWFSNEIRLTTEDRAVLTSSFAFDLGYTSIYPSLLGGAQLHMVHRETYMSPGHLLDYILIHRITYLKMTPSLFSTLVEDSHFSAETCCFLRLVVLGGEAIDVTDIEKAFRICPYLEIMNHYGPTEATIGCIAQFIDRTGMDAYKVKPTIGTPIYNTRVFILDKYLNLLPIGTAGELCVSGAGLAVGYLNHPELTFEKFINYKLPITNSQQITNTKSQIQNQEVPYGQIFNAFGEGISRKDIQKDKKKLSPHSPLHPLTHSLIYRTGDLARLLPHGNIEFLGRIDHQVKIRGYRIELGEIENHLLNHADINEAVVLSRVDQKGENFLCAYVVGERELTAAELREYLSGLLPGYMIPSYFVFLEKLPLTPNAKIDRQALPAPNLEGTKEYIAPRTLVEEKLLELWSEVLGIEKNAIGIDNNFFELGGHSLKATFLLARINKTFNVKIPLAEVFKTPRIRGLAEYIGRPAKERYASIELVEKREYYALSPAQKRLYILQDLEPFGTAYNMPAIIPLGNLRDNLHLEKTKLARTFVQLIQRHDSFRTSFHMMVDEPVQQVHDEVEFSIDYFFATENTGWAAPPAQEGPKGPSRGLLICEPIINPCQKNRELPDSGTGGTEKEVPFDQINSIGFREINHKNTPKDTNETKNNTVQYLFPKSQEPGAKSYMRDFIRPFDLSRAPLLRVGFLTVGQGQNLLLVDMHHIISDGISRRVLERDFTQLYQGETLPPLRIQYKDFSQWQNGEKETNNLKQQEKYWLKEFEGEIPVLELPTDYPRPVVRSFEGDSVNFEITEEETHGLKIMALTGGSTLFMVLAAVVNILLSKLSGQEEIIIGTPIAGRRHADLEKIIGMFVNTLTLRNYPAGDLTFREFLGDVKEKVLMVFENQEYPFEELVDKLSVKRDIGRNPLFDIMFVLQNLDTGSAGQDEKTEIENSQWFQLDSPKEYENIFQTAKFDLTLTAMERGRGLFLSFQYCTKLFKKETIERFIVYFKKIVSIAVKEPGIRLSEIEIISEEEKNRLLYEYNDTKVDFPKDKTIHQLFEEQVERTPDHTALHGCMIAWMHGGPKLQDTKYKIQTKYKSQITNNKQSAALRADFDAFGGQTAIDGSPDHPVRPVQPVRPVRPVSLTYRELNEKSDRLAGLLIEKGVLADNIAGIMMERSVDMIIGILGILKAGGAYLPIDPGYPPERIDFMLKDSSAKVLLTANEIASLSTGCVFTPGAFLNMSEGRPFTSHHSSKNRITHHSSNLAYVIYTSGTTGRPKGVSIQHKSVVNMICYHRQVFRENLGSRISQVASPAFDAMVFEIWPCLSGGAVLCVVDNETCMNPQRMKTWLIKNQITISFQSTLMAQKLLEEPWPKTGISLEVMRTAGDRLTCYPGRPYPFRFFNLYGPTEDTVWTTWTEVPIIPVEQEKLRLPPIGKPVGNKQVYIFNHDMKMQPVGVGGELCISGGGLAMGYLNNPGLTAEKFINFSHNTKHLTLNTRIYRTGDLAHWLPDGNIEFLGRIDHQVKIRGFRIELGEIESRLLRESGIKEAVVLAREEDEGNKYLCAYIVSDREFGISELRENLSKELPDYMIPSYFVRLEKIPLTPSGKVDRKALPRPELKIGESYTAPRNEIEKKLVKLWSEVLNIKKDVVSIDSSFFELGGHSLKATILVSKIHKVFDVKVPLVEIFKMARIKELAKYIKEKSKDYYISIEPAEEKEYYLLSSAQKRLYILQQMNPDSTAYNMPEIIPLPVEFDLGKIDDIFNKLIKRHESLRSSFHMVNDAPVQVVHDEVEFQVENYQLQIQRYCENGGRGEWGNGTAPDFTNYKLQNTNYKQTTIPKLQTTKKFAPFGRIFNASGDQYPKSQEPRAKSFIKDFVRPFDLSCAPLLRVGLIDLTGGGPCRENQHEQALLMVDMHHIISDGVSHGILEKDFLALHEGEELLPLRVQYKDFAEWQKGEKEKRNLKQQEKYWLKEFEGEIPVLELPIDYPRPMAQSFEGNNVNFEMTEEVTQGLKAMALTGGSTLFMVLAAVVNILLSKLSGQEEIIIGTPIAGRRHADLEKIIGMFVNTLTLRNYPAGDRTFREFLGDVKERVLMVFENQEYPFEELVDKLSVKRDIGRNPLFDIMFVLQNLDTGSAGQDEKTEIENNRWFQLDSPKEYENIVQTSKFDLSLTAVEIDRGLLFSFQYCTKLFKKETIEQFIIYFKKIVSIVVREPGIRLGEIVVISEEEKKQIMNDFNKTEVVYPKDKTIHQLFEEQAKRNPDRIALTGQKLQNTKYKLQTNSKIQITNNKQSAALRADFDAFGGQTAIDGSPDHPVRPVRPIQPVRPVRPVSLTYRELNEQSGRLAGWLIEKGVQPGTIVGIMVERSIEMIVGILGILKSGGAYLPIDPEYPTDRIDYMLKDSGAKLLVTTDALAENIGVHRLPMQLIILEKFLTTSILTSASTCQVGPANLAYVIYTSGSTGRPKGVMVEHRNVVRLVKNAGYIHYSMQDRLLTTGSAAFDISTFEIWSPLLNSVMLLLVSKEVILNTEMLKEVLVKYDISILHLIPQLFNQMAAQDIEIFAGLRYFLVGGDLVKPGAVNRLRNTYPYLKILHCYGPTENTTFSTTFQVDKDYELRIPIGKPIGNSSTYIVDKYDHLLPIGVPGELCVGGDGIARGYLNRPELTAEKFIMPSATRGSFEKPPLDPTKLLFNHHSPLYKTGDLVRWLSDGNIEFLGRIDHQVKIRGYRIELGEIENLLLNHPGIKEAAVLMQEEEKEDKYLCAYVVSDKEYVTPGLKEYLEKELPDYMIPSYFVRLEKIPLTPNGKVDRKVLPKPEVKAEQHYVAPRNGMEAKLVQLWTDVLNIRRDVISIDRSFFELGGHSLKATILVTKLKKEFNIFFPLAELFKTPTIKALSHYILTAEEEALIPGDEKLVKLKAGSVEDRNLFLIHDGTGEVEGYVEFCKHLAGGFNCWGLRADRLGSLSPRNVTIRELAETYIDTIKKIQLHGPYYISGWSLGGTIAFEITLQLEKIGDVVSFLGLIDSPGPQQNRGEEANPFGLESEINWVKEYLPDEEIKEKLGQVSQTYEIWPAIVNHLEENHFSVEIIKRLIPAPLAQIIPNYDRLTVRELIYYLNIDRVLTRTQAYYIPSTKVHTPLHYFKASESPTIFRDRWQEYCIKPIKFFEIPGDHFSILKIPNVYHTINIFEKILKKKYNNP